MSFSAGGSNVKGVEGIEQGVISIINEELVFSGTGTKTITLTVPAGKKWIIKSYTNDITGTATLTNNSVIIYNPGASKTFKLYTAGTTPLTYNASGVTFPLCLTAGYTIVFSWGVAADTDGVGRARMIYQELDA